jgi:uncharacterized repeat protein (TIGR03803 family)
LFAFTSLAQAQTFTTLYTFTVGSDGGLPEAGVIRDPVGNLYRTAYGGGDGNCDPPGCGVVYEVNTAGQEAVLYAFSGLDGFEPTTPLARDRAGNLYGTTNSAGFGAVFKIDTAGNETVLYAFTDGKSGCYPKQGVIVDKLGNLYGTTQLCGSFQLGTIYKLDSTGNFTVLHSFTGPSDGASPSNGHLTMDEFGNLYGVTVMGGSKCDTEGCGALYKLSNKGRLTVLHRFAGGTSDGCYPMGSVVQDKAGNLYGTTNQCGSQSGGIIWKVSKKGRETVLHNFAGGPSDGVYPLAGVTRDSKGNLYGVTDEGGSGNNCGIDVGCGTLYRLSASGRLTLLHSFDLNDGAHPLGEVLRTKQVLFGTTKYGGKHSGGTVWKYAP